MHAESKFLENTPLSFDHFVLFVDPEFWVRIPYRVQVRLVNVNYNITTNDHSETD